MSNINATLINEKFPVPGVDNDTVGFRDNFNTIKQNFIAAKAEIESLVDSTAKVTDSETSFRGNQVTNAVFKNNVSAVFNGGDLDQDTDLSLSNGDYQYFKLTTDVLFNITDIPTTGFTKLRLELLSLSGSHDVTFAAGNLTIKKNSSFPGTLTVSSSSDPVILEITTRPSSGVVLIEYKGVFA